MKPLLAFLICCSFFVPFSLLSSQPSAECFINLNDNTEVQDLSHLKWKYTSFTRTSSNVQAARVAYNDSSWRDSSLQQSWKSLNLAPTTKQVWYRCQVFIYLSPKGKSLHLQGLKKTARVFLNGHQVGNITEDTQAFPHARKNQLFSLPSSLWTNGRNVIAIQLKGNSFSSVNLSGKPLLLNEKIGITKILNLDTFYFLMGIGWIILSVFFIVFYTFPLKRQHNLFLSLFCFLLGVYSFLQNQNLFSFFPVSTLAFTWENMIILFLAPLYMEYLCQVTRKKRNIIVYSVYCLAFILFIALLFFPKLFSIDFFYIIHVKSIYYLLCVSLILVFFSRLKEQKSTELSYLRFSLLLILPFFLLDIFHWLKGDEYPYWILVGIFIFFVYSFMRINLAFPNDLMKQEADAFLETHNYPISLENFSRDIQIHLKNFYQVTEVFSKNQHLPRYKHKEYMESVERSTISLENFARDIEYLQVLESGEYLPKTLEIELGNFCKVLVQKTLEDLRENPQRILLKIQRKAIKLTIDPSLLFLGLYHILENSILYTKGKVEFRLEADEKYCKIRIHDQGPGLTQNQKEYIFQKFTRLQPRNSKIPGSGIGLYITRLALEMLNGRIELENNQAAFSSFTVFLPFNNPSVVNRRI